MRGVVHSTAVPSNWEQGEIEMEPSLTPASEAGPEEALRDEGLMLRRSVAAVGTAPCMASCGRGKGSEGSVNWGLPEQQTSAALESCRCPPTRRLALHSNGWMEQGHTCVRTTLDSVASM